MRSYLSPSALHPASLNKLSVTASLTRLLQREPLDYDEEAEPDVYDDDGEGQGNINNDDLANADQAGEDGVVVSGDPSAAAAAKTAEKDTVKSLRDKKVPNDKRTTTPYMTKYEKARVLGTRALQIR